MNPGVAAVLNNLAISNGYGVNGGGIYSAGTLTVSNSTLLGNSAGWAGGGIFNDYGTATVSNSTLLGNSAATAYGGGIMSNGGTLTVSNSTLSGNSAAYDGGGIFNNYGTATVSNSTLSGNSAAMCGGGIYNCSGTLTVSNSTLSGNSATHGGGGIFNDRGTAMVSNSTLSGNSAADGGGIYNYSGALTVLGSIVAGNTGSDPDIYGSVTSDSAYDLIGDGAGMSGISNGDPNHNQVGSGSNPINPLLAPLGNHGGPTETMPLLPGSPAIDAGSNALAVDANGKPLTTDQRGLPRTVNGTVDIGAVESQGYTLTPVAGCTPQTAVAGAALANPLAVTVTPNNANDPVNGGVVVFTAPVSGASAALSAASATIAGGSASVTAATNGLRGAYTVTAAATGAVAPAVFQLGNTEAPSLVVTTLADENDPYDGQTSLPEALAYNASLGGGQTVTFAPGLHGAIDLSTSEGGLGTLTLASNVTIQGPSDNSITIEGVPVRTSAPTRKSLP